MNQLTLPARPDAEEDTRTKAAKLAEAKEQLQAAFSEGDTHIDNAFQSAIVVGHWANRAREAMDDPKTEFSAWFEKNFGEKSRRPRSIQQVYKCMGAADAFECLPEGKKAREAILKRFGTIKGLYAIRGPLKRGEDVLAEPEQPKAPRGRPTKAAQAAKADKAAKANAPSEDKAAKGAKPQADDGNLAIREAEVKRQAKINAVEKKRLAELEEALDKREADLKAREDDLTRRLALLGEQPVQDTEAKAPASPPRARQRGPKAQGKGEGAPQGENASNPPGDSASAPDDAEDLSARAQETVAQAGTETDSGGPDLSADTLPPMGTAPVDGLDPANPL